MPSSNFAGGAPHPDISPTCPQAGISVTCEFQASPRCKRTWSVTRKTLKRTKAANNGQVICFYCSRAIKHSGRLNPNCRYKNLDDSFFEVIDTEAKAYLLGWIASGGSIVKGQTTIAIHRDDRHTLDRLRDIICPDLPIKQKKGQAIVHFEICSSKVQERLCELLEIQPGKKDRSVNLPKLPSTELTWAFIRGYFDGDGSIGATGAGRLRCSIATQSLNLRERIKEFCGIKCSDYGDRLEWNNNNALDFLRKIYHGANYYLPRKYDLYIDWCLWVPGLSGTGTHGQCPEFRWVKTDKRAQVPFKERASDSGYDLTLIAKVGQHGIVELYTTGIKIQPGYGWYFDLVPRSSIIKSGYLIANSVGVIDRTYIGPVIVPLIKIDPASPELALPARIVQVIPRPIVHAEWTEVEEFESTERGAGGFGSTDR